MAQEDERLTVSTVHSAKGLEWDAVCVLRLADGSFPSGFALEEEGGLEEERRLFYVAITRAKRWLALYEPRFVQVRGMRGFSPGCTLLEELDDVEELLASGRSVRQQSWGAPVRTEEDELARIQRILGYFGE